MVFAINLTNQQKFVFKISRLTCDWWFLVLGALQVLLDQFGRHTDNVLTLPVLHHVERLQRADDVTLCDAGHLAAKRERDETSLRTGAVRIRMRRDP